MTMHLRTLVLIMTKSSRSYVFLLNSNGQDHMGLQGTTCKIGYSAEGGLSTDIYV